MARDDAPLAGPASFPAACVARLTGGYGLPDGSDSPRTIAATDGARPLAQNAYKVELAQGVVRQVLQHLRS